ncbi:MAG: SCO1664 family protein [Actinomycetota bacterium]|nr:SCO1664 family protein [Actinomycetota bacterium]
MTVQGRLVSASNATFFARLALDGVESSCVYKPVRGERPLWDFPDGTLAGREVASYLVSELAGWHLVPPTVMADGPFGPGMVQQWVDEPVEAGLVDIVPVDAVPPGWLHVLDAVDQHGEPVALVHADHPALRSLAVFDVVINNADRKGGHVLVNAAGAVSGCDHGVSLHVENKLRTVLWGWAGRPLADDDAAALERLLAALERSADVLVEHITPGEVRQVRRRAARLLHTLLHPQPVLGSAVIPWPAF